MIGKLAFVLMSFPLAVGVADAGSREYFRIARISYLEGHVSFQHAGDVDWSAATVNMPLQPNDRIYTGDDGRAEIEFDEGSVYRMAENADAEIVSMTEDLVRIRVLLGLSTLNVQSNLRYEIETPAAGLRVRQIGVYRFDVTENGITDAIVRKGLLQIVSSDPTRSLASGELAHWTPAEGNSPVFARYDRRDQWDEWNDRRNADLVAYGSRAYLPADVHVGASDLDRYGRWVVVPGYGSAWVPLYVSASWSPYWDGRWCYRPFWGWTWVSYEPWGWLPYHYGRWYFATNIGWCWLPGASFNFQFWSPGLVRFSYGAGWVSWCPLGPGDYYNVNLYHYRPRYEHHITDLRLAQKRGPSQLINREAPGVMRGVRTENFVNNSIGGRNGIQPLQGTQWRTGGHLVTGELDIKPTGRSYAPAPDRPAVRPAVTNNFSGRSIRGLDNAAAEGGSVTSFRGASVQRRETPGTRNNSPGAGNLPEQRGDNSAREGFIGAQPNSQFGSDHGVSGRVYRTPATRSDQQPARNYIRVTPRDDGATSTAPGVRTQDADRSGGLQGGSIGRERSVPASPRQYVVPTTPPAGGNQRSVPEQPAAPRREAPDSSSPRPRSSFPPNSNGSGWSYRGSSNGEQAQPGSDTIGRTYGTGRSNYSSAPRIAPNGAGLSASPTGRTFGGYTAPSPRPSAPSYSAPSFGRSFNLNTSPGGRIGSPGFGTPSSGGRSSTYGGASRPSSPAGPRSGEGGGGRRR